MKGLVDPACGHEEIGRKMNWIIDAEPNLNRWLLGLGD